jgi:hypothetical protein
MTPFCTITPSRGDRPELLEFCKHQLSRMTLKPDKSYFIDYKPESERIDLIDRVKQGVNQAKADGYEYAFIIEDDDCYPKDYFERFDIGEHAFYGSQETIYYNLRNKTYTEFKHQGRSSLFTTGFKISDLKHFNWSAPRNRFLDISIWEHAVTTPGVRQYISNTGAIGIKHNLGLCAGKGHTQRGANTDESLEWLKSNTDSEQFSFYSELMKKL